MSFNSPSSDFVLLASTDASSSASVSFDGYFTSTYKNYQVIFSTVKKSASTKLSLRVRKSNADETGSNYRMALNYSYRSNGVDGSGVHSSWDVSSAVIDQFNNNGTSARSNGIIDIFDPLNTDGFKSIWYKGSNMQNDDQVESYNGGIFFAVTGALSGITLFPQSGNITSGNFKLYGIK